jgi:hypothetical protein
VSPFDQIKDSPVWDAFRRQEGLDPDRFNLTDLWRAAGRPRGLSPRGWAGWNPWHDIDFEAGSPDAPAWADRVTALTYAEHLCPKVMMAVNEAFYQAICADPARVMMNAPEGCGSLVALFVGVAMAADGNRTAAENAIVAEVADRTESLGVYAQETEVARVQRAFIEASKVKSSRQIGGEMVEDR